MKFLTLIILSSLSFSALANHHFQCHKKLTTGKYQSSISVLLIPMEADLTSGGIFAPSDESLPSIPLTFKGLSKDKFIKLGGQNSMKVKIESSGNIRKMVLTSKKTDQKIISEQFKCFIESSI